MNKKNLSSLIALVVVGVAYWLVDYVKQADHKLQPTRSTTATTATKATTSTPKIESNYESNYDTIMRNDKIGQNKNAPVDYYMLALSWSPAFCDLQKRRNDGDVPTHLQYQCSENAEFGWVIHGLWPQNGKARNTNEHPRFCQGDLPEVSLSTIEKYLPDSPGATLLQGQWEKHGSCAFNSAEAYFAKQQELFNQLTLPSQDLKRNQLFKWMRDNNPQLKGVYLGASSNELYICYNKQWQPMDCPR